MERYNHEYRYAGNFYTKGILTVWVGFCDDYGYCISLCGQKDERVKKAIVDSGIIPVVDYNDFDKLNWYTILPEDGQINKDNYESIFLCLFEKIKNIIDLIEK